jgi:hypothetical protein
LRKQLTHFAANISCSASSKASSLFDCPEMIKPEKWIIFLPKHQRIYLPISGEKPVEQLTITLG